MFTLNSGNLTSDPINFPGGTGVMVWDGASIGQTGTLILERKSKDAAASSWTPVGATSIGSGPAQLTIAGTRLFTDAPCKLRLRIDTPSGDILCDVQRCHAGNLTIG